MRKNYHFLYVERMPDSKLLALEEHYGQMPLNYSDYSYYHYSHKYFFYIELVQKHIKQFYVEYKSQIYNKTFHAENVDTIVFSPGKAS